MMPFIAPKPWPPEPSALAKTIAAWLDITTRANALKVIEALPAALTLDVAYAYLAEED